MTVPTFASALLNKSCGDNKTIFPKFDGLSAASVLHVPDEEDEEGGTGDLGGCCVGCDGWPENSPNVMGEMGRVSNGDFVNSPPRHD